MDFQIIFNFVVYTSYLNFKDQALANYFLQYYQQHLDILYVQPLFIRILFFWKQSLFSTLPT